MEYDLLFLSNIQKLLEDLNENNLFNLKDIIIKSKFYGFQSSIYFFVDEILSLIEIKPFSIDFYVDLIVYLYELKPNDNLFVNHLFQKLIQSSSSNNICLLRIDFLKRLYNKNLIPLSKILTLFWDFNPISDRVHFISMGVFIQFFREFRNFQEMGPENRIISIPEIYNIIKKNEENNFQLLDEYLQYGYIKNSIEYSIKYDNLELLQSLLSDNFDFNQNINRSIFDYYIEKSISYFELSAFYGSINCFKYIFLNLDFKNSYYLADYAIFGGNIEIIRFLYDNKINFSN